MVQFLENLFQTTRPRQTLKNLSLVAPLIFSGNLFIKEKFLETIYALFIFIILTSSCYIINDIIDIKKDRLHPLKKNRPIASGEIPIPVALFIATGGIFFALYLSYFLNFFFFIAVFSYFLLQLIYSFFLKNIIIIDVLAIASGFILRVYAGALVINVHMNVWFLLCVISLSLFLAVGKRKAELNILNNQSAGYHRKTLSFYTPDLLDSYISMFANSAWLSYALFTFFTSSPTISQKSTFYRFLPLALSGINKWLMLTIPLVIYGIMRYMTIIYQGNKGESPEKVFLSDRPLLITVLIWALMVVIIIY